MFEGSFRDFMLSDGVLDGLEPAPAVPAGLSDPAIVWPELEVVAQSFGDSVMIHRMDDHDQLLMLLISRGQLYERDADGLETPRRLTGESLWRHLEGLDAMSHFAPVTWSTEFLHDQGSCERFVKLCQDPLFQRLARGGQVIAEFGAAMMPQLDAPVCAILAHESKGFFKALYGPVADHVGQEAAAAAMGLALGLWRPDTRLGEVAVQYHCSVGDLRDAVAVFSQPEGFVKLARAFGLDSARSYLREFLALPKRETWAQEGPMLSEFLDSIERMGTKLKPAAFLKYALEERVGQGANTFDAAHWLDLWAETLAIEAVVHGRVDDKYPEWLLATRDSLYKEALRVRYALSGVDETECADTPESRFERHRQTLDFASFSDGAFIIRPPRDAAEMVAEGRALSHCVASYVAAFQHGDTDIFFLREASKPEKPFVTVEVRDSQLRQAFGMHNSKPSQEVMAWLRDWCNRNNIRFYNEYRAAVVGIDYERERAENAARYNPERAMEMAANYEVRHNRPGTYRPAPLER